MNRKGKLQIIPMPNGIILTNSINKLNSVTAMSFHTLPFVTLKDALIAVTGPACVVITTALERYILKAT